jgi:hypothetical protein
MPATLPVVTSFDVILLLGGHYREGFADPGVPVIETD